MKQPLSYQNTEYDSLATSILNALHYLTNRNDLPLEIVGATNELTLSKSEPKVEEFISWLNSFNKQNDLSIVLEKTNSLDESKVQEIIKEGNVIIANCYGNHFVLVTGIDEVNTYLFDPYYLDIDFVAEDEDYKIICDEPLKYNRIVHNTRFFSNQDKAYSLISTKEHILVKKL